MAQRPVQRPLARRAARPAASPTNDFFGPRQRRVELDELADFAPLSADISAALGIFKAQQDKDELADDTRFAREQLAKTEQSIAALVQSGEAHPFTSMPAQLAFRAGIGERMGSALAGYIREDMAAAITQSGEMTTNGFSPDMAPYSDLVASAQEKLFDELRAGGVEGSINGSNATRTAYANAKIKVVEGLREEYLSAASDSFDIKSKAQISEQILDRIDADFATGDTAGINQFIQDRLYGSVADGDILLATIIEKKTKDVQNKGGDGAEILDWAEGIEWNGVPLSKNPRVNVKLENLEYTLNNMQEQQERDKKDNHAANVKNAVAEFTKSDDWLAYYVALGSNPSQAAELEEQLTQSIMAGKWGTDYRADMVEELRVKTAQSLRATEASNEGEERAVRAAIAQKRYKDARGQLETISDQRIKRELEGALDLAEAEAANPERNPLYLSTRQKLRDREMINHVVDPQASQERQDAGWEFLTAGQRGLPSVITPGMTVDEANTAILAYEEELRLKAVAFGAERKAEIDAVRNPLLEAANRLETLDPEKVAELEGLLSEPAFDKFQADRSKPFAKRDASVNGGDVAEGLRGVRNGIVHSAEGLRLVERVQGGQLQPTDELQALVAGAEKDLKRFSREWWDNEAPKHHPSQWGGLFKRAVQDKVEELLSPYSSASAEAMQEAVARGTPVKRAREFVERHDSNSKSADQAHKLDWREYDRSETRKEFDRHYPGSTALSETRVLSLRAERFGDRRDAVPLDAMGASAFALAKINDRKVSREEAARYKEVALIRAGNHMAGMFRSEYNFTNEERLGGLVSGRQMLATIPIEQLANGFLGPWNDDRKNKGLRVKITREQARNLVNYGAHPMWGSKRALDVAVGNTFGPHLPDAPKPYFIQALDIFQIPYDKARPLMAQPHVKDFYDMQVNAISKVEL